MSHAHLEQLIRDHIPEHMQYSVRSYLFDGAPPGDFLEGILKNDLVHAAGHADQINSNRLFDYAMFLYHAPKLCWGSEEAIKNWIGVGGLTGISKAADKILDG